MFFYEIETPLGCCALGVFREARSEDASGGARRREPWFVLLASVSDVPKGGAGSHAPRAQQAHP